MRILRVAQKVYPDVPGGGPYHVHAMSRDQAAMGHDVTVLTVSVDDSLPRREERDGYTLVRFPPTASVLGNDISAGLARYLWRRVGAFDVVHAHSHLYFATNVAALVRRIGSVPLAITNHGLYSQNAPEWLFDLYLRSLGRWTFDQADVVFCYTEEDSDRLRELAVTSSIEIVANGVDVDRFTPAGPTSELIQGDGPVVLFVGRLVEGKRPQDAIDAFERLQRERDATLYLCGDGPMRESLETRVQQYSIEDSVRFLGHVEYDEMPGIYRSGDVLLLPSRSEGFPRTVLEAFASGVPVVSSHLDHTASIVDEAGETVPVGNVAGYADALAGILTGGSGMRGKRGRKFVEGRFEWSQTVGETTDRLQGLL